MDDEFTKILIIGIVLGVCLSCCCIQCFRSLSPKK